MIDQDLATSLAGGFLASVTGIIVNELIQNPPDLESEIDKNIKKDDEIDKHIKKE